MPKKKHTETPEEQAERFRAEVERLIAAGGLSLTEADEALDKLVREASKTAG
jgi:hypothetical protein